MENTIIDYSVIKEQLTEDILERYDNDEYYDIELRENLITEEVLNFKIGYLINKSFFKEIKDMYYFVKDRSKENNYLLRENDADGEIVAELTQIKPNLFKVVYVL